MNLQELIWLFLVGHTSFARKMVMKCYGELHKIVWKNLTMWVVVHHLAGLASSGRTGIIWEFIQFSSVTQLCPTLCDPMDGSAPGVPVHHQLLEFTQTHVHWISDAIQPSHPLSSPSPPAFNLSQNQGLFKCVSCSHQVAKILEFQLQHQSL